MVRNGLCVRFAQTVGSAEMLEVVKLCRGILGSALKCSWQHQGLEVKASLENVCSKVGSFSGDLRREYVS